MMPAPTLSPQQRAEREAEKYALLELQPFWRDRGAVPEIAPADQPSTAPASDLAPVIPPPAAPTQPPSSPHSAPTAKSSPPGLAAVRAALKQGRADVKPAPQKVAPVAPATPLTDHTVTPAPLAESAPTSTPSDLCYCLLHQNQILLVSEADDMTSMRINPFQGEAGRLLTAMFASIHIEMDLAQHPAQDFALHSPLLHSTPLIVTLGAHATQQLGQPDRLSLAHPADLIRNPAEKSMAWRDLQAIARALNTRTAQ